MENPETKKNRKNKTGRTIALTVAAIILLANTPPAQFFLLEPYAYQNRDGSFRYSEEPGKGMDLTAGKIQFDGWKLQHPNDPDQTLYRTFRIRPWQFWEWWQYLAHSERYSLPYLKTEK